MNLPVQWKMLCPGQVIRTGLPNKQGQLLQCKVPKCEFTCKGSVRRLLFNQNIGVPVGGVQNPIITFSNSTPVGRGFPFPTPEIVIINDGLPTPINGTVNKGNLVGGLPPWTVVDGFIILNTGTGPLNFISFPTYPQEISITGTTGVISSASVAQPGAPILPGGALGIPVTLNGNALGAFSITFEVHSNDSDEGVFPFTWIGNII